MFDVLDTHDSAWIHRRIGLQRMGRTLLRLLPHRLPQLIRPPAHQRRCHYVVERLQALHSHLNSHLGLRWRRPRPGIARSGDTPKLQPAATRKDPFLALQRSYWPPRLPLVVDLFVPASRQALLHPQPWNLTEPPPTPLVRAASPADPEAEEEPTMMLLYRRETLPASRLRHLETLLGRAARGGLTTNRIPWQTALSGWLQLQPQPLQLSGCAGWRRQHIGEGAAESIRVVAVPSGYRAAVAMAPARRGVAPPAPARRWDR